MKEIQQKNLKRTLKHQVFWKAKFLIPNQRVFKYFVRKHKKTTSERIKMGDQGLLWSLLQRQIHIDLRSEEEKAKISGADLVKFFQDHPQVIEVWNLVFI